jgi:hypothetical protein
VRVTGTTAATARISKSRGSSSAVTTVMSTLNSLPCR